MGSPPTPVAGLALGLVFAEPTSLPSKVGGLAHCPRSSSSRRHLALWVFPSLIW